MGAHLAHVDKRAGRGGAVASATPSVTPSGGVAPSTALEGLATPAVAAGSAAATCTGSSRAPAQATAAVAARPAVLHGGKHCATVPSLNSLGAQPWVGDGVELPAKLRITCADIPAVISTKGAAKVRWCSEPPCGDWGAGNALSKAICPTAGAAVLVGSTRHFEIAAGKATAKKWGLSIRVRATRDGNILQYKDALAKSAEGSIPHTTQSFVNGPGVHFGVDVTTYLFDQRMAVFLVVLTRPLTKLQCWLACIGVQCIAFLFGVVIGYWV
jgi:hypothetical protein